MFSVTVTAKLHDLDFVDGIIVIVGSDGLPTVKVHA